MKTRTTLTTILAAALIAGPGAAAAQDFDDDFEDEEFEEDDEEGFEDDFDEEGDDDFDDGGGDDFGDGGGDEGDDMDGGSGDARGLGVGAIVPLGTFGIVDLVFGVPGAPSVAYDMGDYHIDGYLSFSSNDVTTFGVGGRFWYHVIDHEDSDLSVGGGLSLLNQSADGADSQTDFFLEAGGHIRMFLVPQVALTSTFGLVQAFGDNAEGTALGGQALGGVTYYFE